MLSFNFSIKVEIPGITTPYIYFGKGLSVFPIHTEDANLLALSYLHEGLKYWFSIPSFFFEVFKNSVEKYANCDGVTKCAEFLRHKDLIPSIQLLKNLQIPINIVVCHPLLTIFFQLFVITDSTSGNVYTKYA